MNTEGHLLENREHGDCMFPLSTYFVVLTPGPTQQSVNLHWHRETEIVLVTRGAVRARVGMQTKILRAGQMLLVNSGEVHGLEAGDWISEAYALVFDLEWLASPHYDRIQHRFIKRLLDQESRLPMMVTGEDAGDQRMVGSAEQIFESHDHKGEGYELRIKANLYLILYELFSANRLLQRDPTTEADGLGLDRLKPILSFIHQHYAEPIRIGDLAQMIPMSEGYFCRHFHRLIGVTPVHYINAYRINQAASMLQSTDCSVLDACCAVGFQNMSYFTRVFKQFRRMNPSDVRRMSRVAQIV